MSTIKSSAEDLTLNADGSGNDIKFQSNAVEKGSLTDGGVWIGSTFEPTGDTAASDNAAIGYTAAEGLILTGQGSTDDVTIKNDADTTVLNVATGSSDIEVSAGDLIFGTAGKGICLGVTSNTDANTLDDYEEGTWTPVTRTLDESVTVHTATYTKIGNQVHARCAITFPASLGSNANGGISGLPITSKNLGGYAGGGAGVIGNCSESALRSMVVNDLATNGEFRTSTGGSINSDTFEDGWLWISFVYAAQT